MDVWSEIEHCHRREREERAAAMSASDPSTRDMHVMMAERYADRAWSLLEKI